MTIATRSVAPALARLVRGNVIGPDHPGYDDARAVQNRLFTRRPAALVRCADSADVAATVRFTADEGLPLAVRAGGHSAAGHGSVDGGVVVDPRECVQIGEQRSPPSFDRRYERLDHCSRARHPFRIPRAFDRGLELPEIDVEGRIDCERQVVTVLAYEERRCVPIAGGLEQFQQVTERHPQVAERGVGAVIGPKHFCRFAPANRSAQDE